MNRLAPLLLLLALGCAAPKPPAPIVDNGPAALLDRLARAPLAERPAMLAHSHQRAAIESDPSLKSRLDALLPPGDGR